MNRIGVVVPSANTATERVLQQILCGSPAVHIARMRLTEGTREAEQVMLRDFLPNALLDLRTAEVQSVVIACTSGTSFEDRTARQEFFSRAQELSGAPTILTASQLAISAMRDRNWKTVAVLTPYISALGDLVTSSFETEGFKIAQSLHLQYKDAAVIGELSEQEILAALLKLKRQAEGCDGIFISCNNLFLPNIATGYWIDGVEVLTSNGVIVEAIRALG